MIYQELEKHCEASERWNSQSVRGKKTNKQLITYLITY